MIQTVFTVVLALVALSFVEGQGNPEMRPAQTSPSLGGTGGAGGIVVPITAPSGMPTTASQPAQMPQPPPYDIFDWLFNDLNYNNGPDYNVASSNNQVVNNNNVNNNNNAMTNDMMMAMMLGFDFGF
ncbi:conserved oligomeric Golgi complex subunit 8-like [Mizuhopecten yessoensis]|uniref:Uncharacterized protein n=1 Tax=Mizuhopecten yessoensis TaxID=6573 RepID=A0A210R0L1_MIZYE|nr:conserved oligomeric Golgi complex subunit 8-like [Mizuhopecten yessoensis]XP_021345204.1 conserved oligomeric Golgi complex subunit 8-like [Mizuhopecten yessoensis]OWF54455.1 hypothetical protein KP79_PYT21622 [Mizuhopecten yessoensis]